LAGSVPIVRAKTLATSPRSLCTAGTDDVARRLVIELLDALAEVGLHRLDAAVGEERPQLALVGQHRLALDQRRHGVRLQDLGDDLVVLGGVARPVHDHAVGDRVALELDQVVAEVAERVLLDRRGERAQLLPLGDRLRLGVALAAQVPEALVVELGVVLRFDEARRRLGVVDAAHALAPFSTCAMCTNLIGAPARCAQPRWCIRHDMSGETMYSAPAARWSATLSWPILADTGSSSTENVPPKPQHSSTRSGCTISIPFTAPSRRAGLLNAGSLISDALASRSRRSVAQPMCRPTLCGKLGPGKLADAEHVVQELDELARVAAHRLHRRRLLDRGQLVADVVRAASRRRHDVLVAGEVAREQRLGVARLGVAAAVGHRLAAACLLERIVDLAADALEQLERRDPHLGEEGVDVARHEQRDLHREAPRVRRRSGAATAAQCRASGGNGACAMSSDVHTAVGRRCDRFAPDQRRRRQRS
jgi:hypothetical protein